MAEAAERILHRKVEEEMKSSYIDYAMSVIVGRALPDVRDGLKPVHRRVLYAMNEAGLTPDRPYRKSARIVGDVLGKYHPHGDMAVYDTIVRMAQDFSLRYPLVDGQGNFGSVDGDSAAAMRYTEIRLAKIATEMLSDIDRDTVDFTPNYDGSLKEPVVLPSKLPNLLVNGSSGIAVGMATNMPPHNLNEVIDALIMLIENPAATVEELMEVLPGPDFPTGGFICGRSGIREAYETGRGRIVLRAKTEIVEVGGRERIIVREIPYMVNKSRLIESIADLVKGKKIEGISDLRDESDREGMRIVIELKTGAQGEVVLNQLYKHTQMQTTFGIINLALVDGRPRVLSLTELLESYISHRREVVTRRTRFELEKAERRAHILEGLRTALGRIDAVIKLIRGSKSAEEAKTGLVESFGLSEEQAQAILEMRLQRLTALEREKIDDEYEQLQRDIKWYRQVLADPAKVLGIIKEELTELKKGYGDERRSQITDEILTIEDEDLIPVEDMIVTITNTGYIKRLPVDTYRQQRRGGKGVIGMETKEEDFVENLFVASTHDYILFFTDRGRVHWLKVYRLPMAGRYSKGKAIVNLLELAEGEKVRAAIPVREFDPRHFVFFATKKGIVKKTALTAFSRPRRGGIIAILLDDDDELVSVKLTDGEMDIFLATRLGKAIRFSERDVRPIGRGTRGMIGIRLREGDAVIAMAALDGEDSQILTVTENGYGKRTPVSQYRRIRRGGYGVINIITDERNGAAVDVKEVAGDEEIVVTTQAGIVIRTAVEEISIIGRNTKGVRIMRLNEGDKVVAVAKIIGEEENGRG
ncbi:MAG: DNA gyrase subunit A [Methanobacteriota archaeon]|nr:MAG: DNA gyrase subunit A [Euryarchaeota archaeon]